MSQFQNPSFLASIQTPRSAGPTTIMIADTFTGVYAGMIATENGRKTGASAYFQQFVCKPL